MASLPYPVPAHVAPDRVVDVDIYDLPGAVQDVHEAWKALASEHELIWSPRNGGHWIATSAATVARLYRDTEFFSNREISVPAGTMLLPQLPIMKDGGAHRAYRAVIEPAFKPSALERYRRRAQALTVELIEGFRSAGRCEFIGDYASVLPVAVFLTMMDLPLADRDVLHGYAQVMIHDADLAQRHAVFGKIIDYLEAKIAERQANLGDDLLSRVIQAEVFGRRLTHEELLGTASLLMFGGLDTVTSMMGFVMLFLARNPDHRQWMIDYPASARPQSRRLCAGTVSATIYVRQLPTSR